MELRPLFDRSMEIGVLEAGTLASMPAWPRAAQVSMAQGRLAVLDDAGGLVCAVLPRRRQVADTRLRRFAVPATHAPLCRVCPGRGRWAAGVTADGHGYLFDLGADAWPGCAVQGVHMDVDPALSTVHAVWGDLVLFETRGRRLGLLSVHEGQQHVRFVEWSPRPLARVVADPHRPAFVDQDNGRQLRLFRVHGAGAGLHVSCHPLNGWIAAAGGCVPSLADPMALAWQSAATPGQLDFVTLMVASREGRCFHELVLCGEPDVHPDHGYLAQRRSQPLPGLEVAQLAMTGPRAALFVGRSPGLAGWRLGAVSALPFEAASLAPVDLGPAPVPHIAEALTEKRVSAGLRLTSRMRPWSLGWVLRPPAPLTAPTTPETGPWVALPGGRILYADVAGGRLRYAAL